MNTRRFEDLFYRFSLRPSLFICERFSRHSLAILPPFSRHSLAILPPFRCNSPAFQIHFVALSRDFYRKFSALHGSLRQACLILAGSGVVGSPRLLGELFPASMTLQQMNASYLALSCLEHVLLLCTTTKPDREFSSAVRAALREGVEDVECRAL